MFFGGFTGLIFKEYVFEIKAGSVSSPVKKIGGYVGDVVIADGVGLRVVIFLPCDIVFFKVCFSSGKPCSGVEFSVRTNYFGEDVGLFS